MSIVRRGSDLLMLGGRLFLLDEFMDQSRDRPAAKATRRLGLRPVRVSHEAEIKRFFGPDIGVIVKGDLAAFAALKVLSHDEDFLSLGRSKMAPLPIAC